MFTACVYWKQYSAAVIVAGRKCEENLYKQHIDIKFHYNTYPDPVADDSYLRQGKHLVRSTEYLFESQLMQRHNGRVFESLFFSHNFITTSYAAFPVVVNVHHTYIMKPQKIVYSGSSNSYVKSKILNSKTKPFALSTIWILANTCSAFS